jgi:hypothetical protein
VVIAAVAILALTAVPALAEGYNGYSWDGSGNITDGQGDYTRATGYASGPHGGYNSTTNKCQDCHSTHYASGSYMLLRANSREAACDYCHVGGGGSSINIQMDNDYDATSVESTSSRGYGTGHTLGYAGKAPVDIQPAFSDANGLACFDCHTPHGNSARVLTTFANPGRAMEPNTNVVAVMSGKNDVSAAFAAAYPAAVNGDGTYNIGIAADVDFNGGGADTVWGLTKTEGNIVLQKADAVAAMKKPIWGTGRFLLLKNPDNETSGTVAVSDTLVADDGVGFDADKIGYNKLAIDWEEPLGPADTAYGGEQDNDPDVASPFTNGVQGFLAESEFCTDCHDGAAGASTQEAYVWYPDETTNDDTGAYELAYSHDAQPRH